MCAVLFVSVCFKDCGLCVGGSVYVSVQVCMCQFTHACLFMCIYAQAGG